MCMLVPTGIKVTTIAATTEDKFDLAVMQMLIPTDIEAKITIATVDSLS